MKLAMRAKAFSKKVTLFSTAFILAVSSLTAVVPFVLSQEVGAVPVPGANRFVDATSGINSGDCATLVTACDTIQYAVTKAAQGDIISVAPGVYNGDLTLSKKVVLQGENTGAKLNGQITLKSDASGSTIKHLTVSAAGKEYAIGVVGASNVLINNNSIVNLSNSTASAKGIYVGDSDSVNVTISNNLIKGITSTAKGAYGILVNKKSFSGLVVKSNTIQNLKGVWTHAIGLEGDTPDAVVTGNKISSISTYGSADLHPIFVEDNPSVVTVSLSGNLYEGKALSYGTDVLHVNTAWAGSAAGATVLSSDNTYRLFGLNAFADAESAVNTASAGGTVVLDSDVTITSQVTLNKALTLKGNGKTLFTNFAKTSYANNAGIGIQADGVKVENLTVDGTDGADLHGINVWHAQNVQLNDVTLANNTNAGLIVGEQAQVTVNNIHTINNGWYGINVDKVGASLTVTGQSQHNEAKHIYTENRSLVSIDGVNSQYVKVLERSKGEDLTYVLASSAPVASVTVNGKGDNSIVTNQNKDIPATVEVLAVGKAPIKSHWVEIKAPNGTLYYLTQMSGAANSAIFNLRDAKSATKVAIPQDSKHRVYEGVYTIRYVATDVNGVRNDDREAAKIQITIDNTDPIVGASLSPTTVVSNNALPTLTVNASDANGIDYTQYRIQSVDGSNITGYGWVTVADSSATYLSEVAGLADGTYRVNARTFDNAGNKKNELIEFTIDRSITSTIIPSSLTSLTPKLSGVAEHSDGSLAANVDLVVTVDGVDEYETTTDAFGVWSVDVTVTGSEAGVSHTATVALKGSDPTAAPAGSSTFITKLQPRQIQGGTNIQGITAPERGQPQLPPANGFTGQPEAAALGVSDEAGEKSALGASTEKTLADAVDANNTDGKALGLAWYWWILIVAALATIVWWIVAAARKRNAEN